MSKRNNFFGSKSGLTARTIAFLAATGITDTTITNALNTMDLALIANGLDTKMQALYPFVGGTATTHKFNFMNPADTDAAFRIVWSGGITHSATGVLFNGLTGFGDTNINASTDLTLNDDHVSISCITNIDGACFDMGCGNGVSNRIIMAARLGNIHYSDHYDYTTTRVTYANTNRIGYYIDTRTTGSLLSCYKGGVLKGSSSALDGSSPANRNIYIGGWNNSGSLSHPTPAGYNFCTAGSGLTSTDASNLSTIEANFQINLGR